MFRFGVGWAKCTEFVSYSCLGVEFQIRMNKLNAWQVQSFLGFNKLSDDYNNLLPFPYFEMETENWKRAAYMCI